jgi:MGT family glycosyltransferase
MSRVLAYTSPARGHLFPVASILVELRRRGHEIVLRTLAEEVAPMRRLGFEAAPITAEIEALEMDDWKARTQAGRFRRATGVFGARARHDAPDLSRAIEEERPDAVLVDVLTLGAICAAEAWGGPWACFSPLALPLPLASRAGPPLGLGLKPATGALGRWRDRAVLAISRSGFDNVLLADLNRLRLGLGLSPLEHAEELFLAPPLLIYMTAEPFEYPRRDWPEQIVMVGPCAWEPPAELPAELSDVAAPLVLVTTSTEAQDDGRLVEVALEALADEPVHVVATLPADERPSRLPGNATVLGFASHGPILDRAFCAITHGGMGGTQKALAHGVPVCVVPFGRDQAEVARRVEVAGAGSRLPASRLRADRLREKVREAIARRDGAGRVAEAFAASGGAHAAADAFEAMLDSGPR